MRRKFTTIIIALLLALAAVTPVAAITGGQPDGDGHPYAALVLVPEVGFCSGTLIDEDVVLTAGHCTDFISASNFTEVWITFDSEAAVDDNWIPIQEEATWYVSYSWETHPDYYDPAWPFTDDYGLMFLDESVTDITPAALPEEGLLDELIGATGQTQERFYNVGYGQNGVTVGGGPPVRYFDFVRKVAEQRYHPSIGEVGTQDPAWLMLNAVPSAQHGSGCIGDSGSGIFLNPEGLYGDTVIAVKTGGYRMGNAGQICGRITSLNHRLDISEVLDWIELFIE